VGVILNLCHLWIVALWAIFFLYWLVAAIFARRGLNRDAFRGGMKLRVAMFVVILAAVLVTRRSHYLASLQRAEFDNVPLAVSGALLATLGAIVAFVARAAIGRNWGPPATRRTDTHLIAAGPYALIRHPIYSGVLLMMIGTAVGLFPMWWLVAIASGIYFTLSARLEEKFMTSRFPVEYPAYRARTKMFVPFIF
jgi:protein-S-isoprenylcysteine O-methyltransferase Ste14